MIASVIRLECSVLRRMISKENDLLHALLHLSRTYTQSCSCQWVQPEVVCHSKSQAGQGPQSHSCNGKMHPFISNQGTSIAYTLSVALQPNSQSIRSPLTSLLLAVPLHLYFQRIQSSVLLERGGESWRMCYHGDWAELCATMAGTVSSKCLLIWDSWSDGCSRDILEKAFATGVDCMSKSGQSIKQ